MILDKIVEDKKVRLVEHKSRISPAEMRKLAEQCKAHPASFYEGLAKPGISIIGEFKKASPSLGNITSQIDLTKRIDKYNASVDCISCLTEEDHFLGNVDYLKEIREISPLPILRKDFMIDEYQFYEAKVIGANAILLITGILDDIQMRDFYQLTTELGMDALFEAHTEEQMDRALNCGAKIVGVNNRDLRDFTIRLDTTKRLSKLVPDDRIFVAESGIVSDEDVKFLKECRVDAFLIGRAFMESANPQELAKHWKAL
ncbi:indole-3-glycerol phosphate synthase TrpC [uncultured Eubacterium sp.]|uniref:indole-3-glycerol phosphate synthase TrpC n=1 Tax=uncultured Eubacterium sp. TaxID=165185 RepID=UPI0025EDE27B|nr:indole-3-glycerol phosphate synthase TrpC [uncultured Eubacterium sp.]